MIDRSKWVYVATMLAACVAAPEVRGQEAHAPAVEVPSTFRGNHAYVRVALASMDTAWLLLDTGAQLMVLDSAFAARVASQQVGTSTLSGVGAASVQGRVLRNVQVQPVGAPASIRTLAVVDLSPLRPYAGAEFHGFLGAPVLSAHVVEIDYQGKRIFLHDPKRFVPTASDIRIPFKIERGAPIIEGTLMLNDGTKMNGRFMIDTGMATTLKLNSPFVARKKLAAAISPTVPQRVAGIGGQTSEQVGRIAALSIGKLVLDSPTIELSSASTGLTANAERAGIIGGELLRRFTVTIDYGKRALYLRPNEWFEEPFDTDMSGIALIAAGSDHKTLVIDRLYPDSPASMAGLVVGDTLVRIDGSAADEFTLWSAAQLLRSRAGRIIELVVRRNGKEEAASLTLKRRV